MVADARAAHIAGAPQPAPYDAAALSAASPEAYPRRPVFFLVDTRERPQRRERRRLPRWLALLAILVVVAFATGGVIAVIAWFTILCLLIDRALPSVSEGGLRNYRQ
jgi:hypothetical protein